MKKINFLFASILLLFSLTSCNDNPSNPSENPEHDLPNSLIFKLSLLDDSGSNEIKESSEAIFDQPGGPGTIPIISPFILKSDDSKIVYYKGLIVVQNKTTDGKITDLTPKILDEAEYHQFFYENKNSNIIFLYDDKESDFTKNDKNGKDLPIGYKFKINVMPNSANLTDTLTVSLSHFDDPTKKDGKNKSNETDIYVKIPIKVIKK